MEYSYLGKSGLQVSKLSFGSWITFGNQFGDTTSEDLMKYAYDNGINFFDNAEIYANGESEVVMGKILKKMGWDRTSYVVSSKVYFGDGRKAPNQTGLSRKHITEACHDALKRLQVDYLDLFFCHRPDKKVPMEETVRTMNDLIRQGKVLYWGTSEWSGVEIMEAHMIARQNNLIGPVMEQPQYNMLVRDKVEVEYKKIYDTVGLGTTTWSPLASGLLTSKYLNNDPSDTRLKRKELSWLADKLLQEKTIKTVTELNEFATKELGTSLPKLAIAWCAKNKNVSTVILGASKLSQLEETIHSLEVIPQLKSDVLEKIEGILANTPVHPQW